jgi:hypothetical protein
MFVSISNQNNNNFPSNLKFDMSIYHNIINSNQISFTINMSIFDYSSENSIPYDISFIGSYLIDTKKLSVSQKGHNNFKDEFYFNGQVLVSDLFAKYILPHLI